MADNCQKTECQVWGDESVLLIAPCNTLLRIGGKPVIDDATINSMYRLLFCGALDYQPDVTTTKRKKGGACGGTSCYSRTNGYDITIPLDLCKDDPWVCALTHVVNECEFDFIFFPHPEDCAAPVATDFMWVGTAKTSPSGQTFDPDGDTPVNVEVVVSGCTYPLCVLNDCEDTPASGNVQEAIEQEVTNQLEALVDDASALKAA